MPGRPFRSGVAATLVAAALLVTGCSDAGTDLSYEDAAQAVHAALARLGYDTSEGDDAGPQSQSFLAVPANPALAELQVAAARERDEPAGDYTPIGETDVAGERLPVISRRGEVDGVWFTCRGLYVEILAEGGVAEVVPPAAEVLDALGC